MSDQVPPDLSKLDRNAWMHAMEEIGEDKGYFEPLGESHSAVFCDEGGVLLVSFETVESARARKMGLPFGLANTLSRGWSSLTILAEGATWFRDKRLYGYFDRLVDDGFFEDFDRVIFIGSDMCAYAACAYSVAAPGATVLAFRPRATLDTERAGWEERDTDRRRLDFTDRYGYAPHMSEAAEKVFLFYDPADTADAVHVAFFQCDNAIPVRIRYSNGNPLAMITGMGVLTGLLSRAGAEQGLEPIDVYRILRRRKLYHGYTRAMISHLGQQGQIFRYAKAARYLFVGMGRGRYAKDHHWASERLSELGLALPPRMERSKSTPAAELATETA